jgi:hypothetical protein
VRFACCFVVLALGACTADLGTVRFQMPVRIFRFGTSGSLWATAPSTLPEATCAADGDCCRPLSSVAIDCARVKPTCQQGRCAMVVVLERAQPIWLMRDVPDLGLIDGGARARLRMTHVRVSGLEARPDAPAGELSLYLGPYEAQSWTDKGARLVAVASGLHIGGEESGEAEVTDAAAPMLRELIAKPSDPFSMVAVTRLPIASRAEVPRGDYVVALDIELATSLGL